jgi:hypothetical protein
MPSPSDRDELEAQDPFQPAVSDRGYRIGARIGTRENRRPRVVAFATVAALVGAIAIGALGLRVTETSSRPSAPPPLPSGRGPAIATPLPQLATYSEPQPVAPIPVLSGGLRWLDPATGVIVGSSGALAYVGWTFPASDGGAWCVCSDSPWSQSGSLERVTVVHYDARGAETSRTTVEELRSTFRSANSIVRDAVRSTDGTGIYVASAVRNQDGWAIRLDRIPLPARVDGVATIDLGLVASTDGHLDIRPPVVRVSPDGRWARVAIRYTARDPSVTEVRWQEQAWLVPTSNEPNRSFGGGSSIVRVIGPRPTQDPSRCNGEAWATSETYLRLCQETSGESLVPVAHIENLDGSSSEVDVGEPVGRDDLDWLLDADAGVVYRWSRFSHVIARLDVRTLEVRAVDLSQFGERLESIRPNAEPSRARAGRAVWMPLQAADGFERTRLAGSFDGSLLYAIGMRAGTGTRPSGPLLASTGIWVFDAATLGLVGHWQAAAMYDEVGLTPDGRFVLATGAEGMNAEGLLADWSSSLSIHDVEDGKLVEQIGRLFGDTGFFVQLLVPGPVP